MKKILIVDDQAENLYLLERLLETSQMSVISAENGKAALEKAYTDPPDLIVSDILMPVMDGYSLCKIWKSDERLKKIPFIFYTATYTEPKDEAFALALGAERFIVKPQEPHVLINLLKGFLKEEPDGKPADRLALGSEMEFFRQYKEVLFNKLEKKMIDLEEVNSLLIREIDGHKRTEEKLLRLTHAMEESPVSIVMMDLEGNVEYANPKTLQISGYSRQEIIGRNLRNFTSEEIQPDVYKELWRTIVAGSIWRGELCNKKKDGELYWVYATVSPIKNARGVVTNFMALQEDISERRKLEEQLRQAQKLEGIGQLASGVAHDFNNILTAIIGYAYLAILNMQDDDPLRRHIQQILEYSEKGSALTKSLLAFSRKQTAHLTGFDLNNLISNFHEFLRPMLREDIEMQTICTNEALPVMADKGQIEQVIMNLATNASDAMPEGGSLIISTSMVELTEDFIKTHGYGNPGQYAEISATDTGVGMDQSTVGKIFEPFFTTKEQGKGTGLGLAIVYGIVRKHDGCITVESEPGKGTTFKIMLPIVNAIESSVKKTPQDLSLRGGGTETILLAEDDEGIRDLFCTVLTDHGYNVINAADGEEALCRFNENKEKVDIAILDGIMPKKRGKEVFHEIRGIKPEIKVVFVSGYSEDMLDFEEVEDKGVICLQKPVSLTVLLKKIREILDVTNP